MTHRICAGALIGLVALVGASIAQPTPDLLWYQFEDGPAATAAANTAVPGVGVTPSPITAGSISATAGCNSSGAYIGATTGFVDTGWNAGLGTSSFSVGFSVASSAAPTTALHYIFGLSTAGAFRCFANGIAGTGNTVLRGPLTDVIIPAGYGADATHNMWVYDATAGTITGYRDGVPVVTVNQAALSIGPGTTGFRVGGYNGSPTAGAPPTTSIDDFRFYGSALTAADVALIAAACPPPPALYQQNSADISMDVNGLQGTKYIVADQTFCDNFVSVLNLTSTNNGGNPWDMLLTVGVGTVPFGGGAISTAGGNLINMDLGNSTALHGLSFGVPFTDLVGLGFQTGSPIDIEGQSFVLCPTFPDLVCWSQPNEITAVGASYPGVFAGPNGDDNFTQVNLGSAPICGAESVPFAGTVYSSFFVNSNGSVSFGAGDTQWAPTVALFLNGAPRIAPFWTDLSPNLGGTITTTVTPGNVNVSYSAVPQFGGGTVNSVIVDFAGGGTTISGYAPDPAHSNSSIIGLTPGGGATDPTGGLGYSFLGLMGGGAQAGAATDGVYEFAAGLAVPGGWNSIVFPNSDATSWIVN